MYQNSWLYVLNTNTHLFIYVYLCFWIWLVNKLTIPSLWRCDECSSCLPKIPAVLNYSKDQFAALQSVEDKLFDKISNIKTKLQVIVYHETVICVATDHIIWLPNNYVVVLCLMTWLLTLLYLYHQGKKKRKKDNLT